MPTNTPLPTVSTGGTIAASTTNDAAVLNTCVGLFGVSGTLTGSAPPVTAPNFEIQAGQLNVSFSSGLSSAIGFPHTYPNGVIGIWPVPFVSGTPTDLTLNLTGATTSQFSLGATNSGASYTGSFVVVWFALGF